MPDEAAEPVLTEYEKDVLRAAGDIIVANGTATHGSIADRIVGPEVVASSDAMLFGAGPPSDRAADLRTVRSALLDLNTKGLIEIPNGAKPAFLASVEITLREKGWEWYNANAG